MIFGIWWGWWIFFAVLLFVFCRMLYCGWQATRPITDDEKWAPAFNKAWNDSLDKLANKKQE
jgi:hypothetical protein